MLLAFPNRPRRYLSALCAVALILPLASCGGMGESLSRTFGFTRDSPDEFAVTTQAPLTLPPDYSIRPPQPGAPRPQDVPDRLAAQEALIPQTALASNGTGMSAGQAALVQEAGPPAPANIRAQIAQEQGRLNGPGQSFADRLLFWRAPQTPGIAVNPELEFEAAERECSPWPESRSRTDTDHSAAASRMAFRNFLNRGGFAMHPPL